MLVLLTGALREGRPVTVPATVLAQVVRDPRRQVALMRLLARGTTTIADLDRPTALEVGRLLAVTGTADIVDAHVVVVATDRDEAIVTSDPDDLARLAPGHSLIAV